MARPRRFKTPKEPKGPKYMVAPEVEALASKIIDDHHSHLAEARIKYLFRNGKWAKKAKTMLGQAKLATDDVRFIAEYDFIIFINLAVWNTAIPAWREALLDHELSHCDCSQDKAGNKKWGIVDHDVQEFVSVVRRHGLWEVDLQRMVKAANEAPSNQIEMFASEKPETVDEPAESETKEPEGVTETAEPVLN
jgi:hypothetical protein